MSESAIASETGPAIDAVGDALTDRLTSRAFLFGVIAGLCMLGPALGPGALLNLDLAVVAEQAMPQGLFGLATDIPRAHPFDLILVSVGRVLGTTYVVKLFYVFAVGVAAAGMSRLVPDRRSLIVYGAALLYACSPFMLTRMAVGHLTMVGGFALLPWTVRPLVRHDSSDRETFLAGIAMGLMGVYGGLLTGALVLTRWLRTPAKLRRASWQGPALAMVGQIPWLAVGLVAMLRAPQVEGSDAFPSVAGRPFGPLRLLAGHAFWQDEFQIGAESQWIPPVLGLLTVALAVVGFSHLDQGWARPARAVGLATLVLVVVDGVPGLRRLMFAVTDNAVGAVIREPQRLLPLALIVLIPAAAVGAGALADHAPSPRSRRMMQVVPLTLALALGAPGLWALGGQIRPVELPPGWHETKRIIEAERGPVLVVPYSRYMTLRFVETESTLVLNPMARHLGGDVIQGSDIGLGDNSRETVDPREDEIMAALRRYRAGEPISDSLALIGIRWIVLLREGRFEQYGALSDDAGLTERYADPDIELFAISDWVGPAALVTPSGRTGLEVERPVPFVAQVARSGSESVEAAQSTGVALWWAPRFAGWLGAESSVSSNDGAITIGLGQRAVFWPAILLVSLHLLVYAAAALTAVRHLRSASPRRWIGRLG